LLKGLQSNQNGISVTLQAFYSGQVCDCIANILQTLGSQLLGRYGFHE
jgi:hypothetical protein